MFPLVLAYPGSPRQKAVKRLRVFSIALSFPMTPSAVDRQSGHRHRIDKCLDTLLANQPISDGKATDHCQKGAPQDGGLPELIVAQSYLTNHSEAASL